MAFLSGLRKVSASHSEPDFDGDSFDKENDLPPEPVRRFTPFMPTPRGLGAPVMGNVADPATRRAFAEQGSGWVSRDGRAVSGGSYHYGGHVLRRVPELEPLFRGIDMLKASAEESRKADYAEALGWHIARGGREEDFERDTDMVEILASRYRDPDVNVGLRRAGWEWIELRQDHGVKEVHCRDVKLEEGDSLLEHLRTMAAGLKCRLTARIEPKPLASPTTALSDPAPSTTPAVEDEVDYAPAFRP